MLKAEAQLEKEIKELMRKAEILDAQEDSKYGKGKLGSDLPKELQRRQDRLAMIFKARKALEAEAAAAALPVIAPSRQQRQKLRLPMLTRKNKRMPASS